MTSRAITGALFVDLGEGREIKSGRRAGEISWTRTPRARYECLLCRTSEGPVEGAARNPQTGEPVQVPARQRLRFRVADHLQAAVCQGNPAAASITKRPR